MFGYHRLQMENKIKKRVKPNLLSKTSLVDLLGELRACVAIKSTRIAGPSSESIESSLDSSGRLLNFQGFGRAWEVEVGFSKRENPKISLSSNIPKL